MKVVVVEYNAGNVKSVLSALEKLGVSATLTDDRATILSADRVIFPGVGEASTTMRYLQEKGLDQVIASLKQPVLGICLGLQLMCKHSEENDTPCLGIFDIEVRKFLSDRTSLFKVPHMGWNTVTNMKGDLFNGISEETHFYFVHSYYAEKNTCSIGLSEYSLEFSAALQKDNFYAVQFHPEKSSLQGEKILKNFIEL